MKGWLIDSQLTDSLQNSYVIVGFLLIAKQCNFFVNMEDITL